MFPPRSIDLLHCRLRPHHPSNVFRRHFSASEVPQSSAPSLTQLSQSIRAPPAPAFASLYPARKRAAFLVDEPDARQDEVVPFETSAPALPSASAQHEPVLSRWDWRLISPRRKDCQPLESQKTPPQSVGPVRRVQRVQPPRTTLQKDEPFFGETAAYEKRFFPLLEAEQLEDQRILRERLASWSMQRLINEGYCFAGMSAYWTGTQSGMPVASFSMGPGVELGDHRFTTGTKILLSRADPLRENATHGSVVGKSATHIRVAFAKRMKIDGVWRLDIAHSSTVFDRMRQAISSLDLDPSSQIHGASSYGGFSDSLAPEDEYILQGTHLRDVLLRSFSSTPGLHHEPHEIQDADDTAYPPPALETDANHPDMLDRPMTSDAKIVTELGGAFQHDQRIQSWATRYTAANPVRVEGDPELALNGSQTRAVAMMLGTRCSLVQGPPGTGKTKTIIEAVKLLKAHFAVPHPLLVCTYTNMAVDHLVEGLASAGLNPLRVSNGGTASPSIHPHTLEAKSDLHPLAPSVRKLTEEKDRQQFELSALERRMAKLSKIVDDNDRGAAKASAELKRLGPEHTSREEALDRTSRRLYAIKMAVTYDVVREADVVCTTCISAATYSLNVIDFPVVFLDEASMSTEPASLIPIMKGCQHLALIGDHKQLPPVIVSRDALAGGLGISLFERLTEEGVVPSIMLDQQYRMHPQISRFPSREFYNLRLYDGMVGANGSVPDRLAPPASRLLDLNVPSNRDRPSVIFLDHESAESQKDRSKLNYGEADIVCSVIEDLLLHNPTLNGADVGIIAPYVAQISLLSRLLATDQKRRERFQSVLGDRRAMELPLIEVKTVDGFEGREKEVIVFSTVRSNPSGQIGFLADRRRLNVGLTRAKRGLFVVGNLATLQEGRTGWRAGGRGETKVGHGGEAWQRYAKYLKEEKLVLRLTGDRLRQSLYGNLLAATGKGLAVRGYCR